jgi:hypothetical protein
MPRPTRKPHERRKANRQQQARERQAAELERKFHAEWRLRETAVDEADEQPTQPEIDTTDDNNGDDQP